MAGTADQRGTRTDCRDDVWHVRGSTDRDGGRFLSQQMENGAGVYESEEQTAGRDPESVYQSDETAVERGQENTSEKRSIACGIGKSDAIIKKV